MKNSFNQQRAYIQLTRLQKVSSLLVRAQDTHEIAEIVVGEGFEAMGAISGDVILLSEDKEYFDVLAYRGYPKDFFKNIPNYSLKTTLLTNIVIQSKKPYFLEDANSLSDEYKTAKKFMSLSQSNSAALFPLKSQKNVLGILQFTFKDPQSFTIERQKFMGALANQCAQALERAIALEKLQESKEELEIILRSVADSVTVRNPEGTIIYANDAAVKTHLYDNASELIGLTTKDYEKLFLSVENEHGKPAQKLDIPAFQVYAGKKYAENIFKIVFKKNNTTMWAKIKSVGIYDKSKKLQYIVTVTQDITKEKQKEYSKDEFISIASHELKTPVTSLKAFAQVLQKKFEKEKNEEAAKLMAKMNYQVDRLTTLIIDLLDVTKIEGGKLALHEELVHIDDLVKDIVEEMQRITTSHTITFKGNTNSYVIADKERTSQVITNLLTNAVKYSPDGDKVVVSLQKKQKEVVISVQDFGMGIPKNKQQHIFKPFYRELGFKENTFPGLGLGLYITAQIIKRQKGKIWVKSRKGIGSTFYFSLPISQRSSTS